MVVGERVGELGGGNPDLLVASVAGLGVVVGVVVGVEVVRRVDGVDTIDLRAFAMESVS